MFLKDEGKRPKEGVLDHILFVTQARPLGRDRWIGRCPSHEDRSPSLSIGLKGDRILLYCFAGCSTESVLQAMGLEWRDLFQGEGPKGGIFFRSPSPYPRPLGNPNEARRTALEKVWIEALPLGTPATEVGLAYLRHRGLDPERILPELDKLRFHPALPYREGKEVKGHYPALLARVEHPEHGLVALHRTYLAPDGRGKAPVESPKKLTRAVLEGGTMGAAVRLYPPGDTLALAEGLETALAVRQASGLPTWAAVSAGGMEAFQPPEGVERVVIAADHDSRGIEAAHTLGERLLRQGLWVRILVPPVRDWDWLDALAKAPYWCQQMLRP